AAPGRERTARARLTRARVCRGPRARRCERRRAASQNPSYRNSSVPLRRHGQFGWIETSAPCARGAAWHLLSPRFSILEQHHDIALELEHVPLPEWSDPRRDSGIVTPLVVLVHVADEGHVLDEDVFPCRRDFTADLGEG